MSIVSRISCIVLAFELGAAPAAAQLLHDPVQISPRGGTGLTIAADAGHQVKGAPGDATTFNGRVTLGVSALQVTVGVGWEHFDAVVSRYEPGQPAATRANFMGQAAVTLIPSTPVAPIAVALFAGVGRATESGSRVTTVPVGLAIGLDLRSSGIQIEPWVAPRLNRVQVSGREPTTYSGFSGGLNVDLLAGFGFQAALDYFKASHRSYGFISVGAHYRFSVPGLQ